MELSITRGVLICHRSYGELKLDPSTAGAVCCSLANNA